MHAPLPVYGSVTQCSKCTGCTFTEAYRMERPVLSWRGAHLCEAFIEPGGECILRGCIDCGYRWLEQCADADAGELHDVTART